MGHHMELEPAALSSASTNSVILSRSMSKSSWDLMRLILVYRLLASFQTPDRVIILALSSTSEQSPSSSLSHLTHA